ncbi:hypothetical protein LX36DRAFT_733961 [Colletotrichum falcatum]|nr:hypothetical protein LX36DRAFT_733961 [Colletotrichum falcatum]
MAESDFISWDKHFQEYRQTMMDNAHYQLNVRLTRLQLMVKTLEDATVVFGALQNSGSSSTPGMDEIQQELTGCHSAFQSLARLRRREKMVTNELNARCATLADAQRRRTIVQRELVRVIDAIPKREILDARLETLRPWDVLDA